ncbi:MAG: ACT domain-containing protein [Candidatus Micrarchaeia archaeon]
MKKENISNLISLYVKRRPFIKESLRDGIINYSSLARKISYELYGNHSKTGAIKVALQRLSKKLIEKEEDLEQKILAVLKNSSLDIKNKIAVVISSSELNIKPISYAKSDLSVTYILKEEQLLDLKKERKIKAVEKNLNLITIKSREELENTPGVLSMILGALAIEGINIQEIISCYTDTLIVVKESDTSRAYDILNALLK